MSNLSRRAFLKMAALLASSGVLAWQPNALVSQEEGNLPDGKEGIDWALAEKGTEEWPFAPYYKESDGDE